MTAARVVPTPVIVSCLASKSAMIRRGKYNAERIFSGLLNLVGFIESMIVAVQNLFAD